MIALGEKIQGDSIGFMLDPSPHDEGRGEKLSECVSAMHASLTYLVCLHTYLLSSSSPVVSSPVVKASNL